MEDIEQRAVRYKHEAIKKLSSKSFLQSLFGTNKTDQAIDYYQRSGNLFKMLKNWKEASYVFSEAAELQVKIGNEYDAGNSFVNAANCSKKYDLEKAIYYLFRAIEIYASLGKFATAAKYHKTIAELYHENQEIEKALKQYEQAAEYYKNEDNLCAAKACLIIVAEQNALREDYAKAIQLFEQVADYELNSNLLKYSAKDRFFQAALCQLCLDDAQVPRMIEKFNIKCPFFGGSREEGFINLLCKSIECNNLEEFNFQVKTYDSVSKFSTWYISVLLKIKRRIEGVIDLK
ncbi:unnamed protein product [Brassicogethes aeneus]|uniref:Uncharacterized protein n=1 Tax=Brassicogethes aeneus TaxID=1431903 RepID=A0A9P0B7R2_BRAAE|nr:unnamed protein product [Brassicogethes aeneus]